MVGSCLFLDEGIESPFDSSAKGALAIFVTHYQPTTSNKAQPIIIV